MNNIRLIKGSCVEQNADAIVNAANRYLVSGGGVCGEIFRRAGYFELNDACKKISTPLNDGDAVITPSFNIDNCKYIIHAVGPDFGVNSNAFDELEKAYYNSLMVLKNNNLHSISFPLISSGIYGGNLDNPSFVSAKGLIDAYNKFIMKFSDYDLEVILCAYSNYEFDSIKELFNTSS